VPHLQRHLKPQNVNRKHYTPADRRLMDSNTTAVQRVARCVPQTLQPARFAASVWYDALASVLLCTGIAGILAYFLGWVTALVVPATVIVSLAWCLNRSIDDTIEL